MITTDDLSWEDQKALQRQLDLCAKNLNKLIKMVENVVGPNGNVFMDASTRLYVMDDDDHGSGSSNASAGDRQEHILLYSPTLYGRIGAGDW